MNRARWWHRISDRDAPSHDAFLYAVRRPESGWNVGVAYRAKDGSIRNETGMRDLTHVVSHWMHLPPPPEDD